MWLSPIDRDMFGFICLRGQARRRTFEYGMISSDGQIEVFNHGGLENEWREELYTETDSNNKILEQGRAKIEVYREAFELAGI